MEKGEKEWEVKCDQIKNREINDKKWTMKGKKRTANIRRKNKGRENRKRKKRKEGEV
jgi:hypothetical protein